ncbi:DUF2301 domain-containing membrane protein [Allocoleopsis franciscana]|uniref:Uncharacterized integral membrane protein n=1 Tax=Allocoleopsis franciscana PCC 7113 TaxID=1173027 RepID=K9WHQ9_9CYAN|nr:DUF2301 domain-containing membrane protein [Allocoleopsis franciscana]AFZ19945.1 uncharacterized integral membrane protein [Allocoleopsis franciscana PCC 7113]
MGLQQSLEPEVYQGQFGEFTINQGDRTGVIVYRSSLLAAALSFALGSGLILAWGDTPSVLTGVMVCYALFWLALGVSLVTIHIYLVPLHRLLQIFWAIGGIASMVIAFSAREPFALFVYNHPIAIFGVGFTFAALTGIYFKEAFCFNRFETKFLTPLVPILLLGHLAGVLPTAWEQSFLAIWAVLFMVFALRKLVQPIPGDIGDKSVFAYLQEKRTAHS